jgi:hypothetical protein
VNSFYVKRVSTLVLAAFIDFPSAILVLTSTLICQYGLTCSGQSRTALLHSYSVRRSIPHIALETLVVSLGLARLGYGSTTLAGIPANLLRRLHVVLNASARTITGLPRSVHIITSLAWLHWLRCSRVHLIQVGGFDLSMSSLRCPPLPVRSTNSGR